MKKYVIALIICSFSVAAYSSTTYTSSSNITIPSGVNYILVQAWGAGGNGVTVSGGIGDRSGGGGGGGAFSASIFPVTPTTTYNISVGAASGTGSWFNNTASLYAQGGGNGSNSGAGGAGGNNTSGVGQIKYSGGNGGEGTASIAPYYSGSGGGGAGSTQNGYSGVMNNGSGLPGGAGGALYGGDGGAVPVQNGNADDGLPGSVVGGGGSGAWSNAGGVATGGAGARGQVIIYTSATNFSLVTLSIKSTANNSLLGELVNITLQSPDTLVTYNFINVSSSFSTLEIEPGTYYVSVTANGFPTTTGALTVSAGTAIDATYYVDSAAIPIVFSVVDTLGNNVIGAVGSFSKNINGTIVVVTQGVSDFTGFFTVNLNPTSVYSLTVIDPSGSRLPFTGTIINPVSTDTYTIVMQISGDTGFNSTVNNTYTNINATYNNITKTINVTWEVISPNGTLDWFSLNTTYNTTNYSQNISSSTGGGIASVLITNVNLTFQNQINVTFQLKNNGYTPVLFTTAFQFNDYTTSNSSLVGGLFSGNNAPLSPFGRAILGMTILVISVAGAYAMSGNQEFTALFGVVIVSILSIPSVNIFNPLFGLITVVVILSVIIVKVIR